MIPPILRDFPDTIETERLLLRPPRAGDGPVIYEATLASQYELAPWMSWAMGELDPQDSEIFARNDAADWLTRKSFSMLIFRKDDGVFVGGCKFHHVNWDLPSLEIGYWLDSRMTGQGYMSEAIRAFTGFGFDTLGVERIEIRCDARNHASAGVARRCGYLQEGYFRHDDRDVHGELCDTLIFAMIRSDYLALQSQQ